MRGKLEKKINREFRKMEKLEKGEKKLITNIIWQC